MFEELKARVYAQNLLLAKNGLEILPWNNLSAIDRQRGLLVVKPDGVAIENLTVDDMLVVDILTRKVVEGKRRTPSDLATKLYLYEVFPEIESIVHTYSPYATAWAQCGESIPVFGTLHASSFGGAIPCTRAFKKEEVQKNYEINIGKVIAEAFATVDYNVVPAVLVKNQTPFVWGATVEKAAENAIALEEVAKTATIMKQMGATSPVVEEYLLSKHYPQKSVKAKRVSKK